MGAIEHRYLLERDPFIEKFHHALRHKGSLLSIRGQRNQGWLYWVSLPDRSEIFWKLLLVAENRRVGEV